MKQQQAFPDLIKAGLKAGDKVYSYLFGKGVVKSIIRNARYPIQVDFGHDFNTFTSNGKRLKDDLIPTLTIQPWNPVAGEPFPFPKFEPKVGFAYAFWDDDGVWSLTEKRFSVSIFTGIYEDKFKDYYGSNWRHCAPISEAMRMFGIKEEHSHE